MREHGTINVTMVNTTTESLAGRSADDDGVDGRLDDGAGAGPQPRPRGISLRGNYWSRPSQPELVNTN